MRISTQMMYQQNMRGVTDAQSEWLKSGEQMSTGKRVLTPSDDPIAAAQAVVLSQAQAQNSQYATARGFAKQRVSLEDSVLGAVATSITAAQEKLVYANNGTLSDTDKATVATDLQGIRDQLMNLANSTDGNGRYIFGGYKTATPPFDSTTGAYSGGTNTVTQQVDSSRSMVIGHTGTQIFETLTSNAKPEPDGSAPENKLFAMLDSAIAALKVPVEGDDAAQAVQTAAVEKSSRGLTNALDAVGTVIAEVGVQLNELDELNNLGTDRGLGQTEQMSNLVDVDITSAISSYVMKQAALQASYKAFSDMQGMSLFQINK